MGSKPTSDAAQHLLNLGCGSRRNRPIAAVHVHLRMLRCGPSNRTFVHYAAFLLAETSVCGTNRPSFFVVG
jgi:hypothetical protein